MSRAITKAPQGRVLTLHADYLQASLLDPAKVVRVARKALKDIEFDTMVSRGLSGALVVPMLARALKKRWLIVRKDGDGSHSTKRVEGTLGERWMFIDDLVSSGHTMRVTREMVEAVCAANGFTSRFVGAWTYTNDQYYDSAGTNCEYDALLGPQPVPVRYETPQPTLDPNVWAAAADYSTNDLLLGFMIPEPPKPVAPCKEGYTPKPKRKWRKNLRDLIQQQESRAMAPKFAIKDGKFVRVEA